MKRCWIHVEPITLAVALVSIAMGGASGCGKGRPSETSPAAPPPADAASAAPIPSAPSSGGAAIPPTNRIVGYIFGVPVPAGNYYFAKLVSRRFPRPWEERASPEDLERSIWEALILHYEAFRQGVTLSEEQLEERINGVLRSQQQSFARHGDPAAYDTWVKETVGEDVELFEHQMRYLFTVDVLKERMRESFAVTVTEDEMQQEFLNEHHHIAGEMAVFDAREEADAFYQGVREPAQWEAMNAKGDTAVRPVSMMTLEAYIDLWGVSKDQAYALHALEIGSVGPPMPFGKQWCVYRLLEKRTGDVQDFPAKRDSYLKQLQAKKQYAKLVEWLEALKASAKLVIQTAD